MQTRRIPCRRGPFHVTAEPERRSLLSELCCLHIFLGEYEYPRAGAEPVKTMVDVGCNVGAVMVWAADWWPTLERIDGYDPNASALEFAAVNTRLCEVPGVSLHHAAVSLDPAPLFKEHDDWGGSRTHGERAGVPVPSLHPRDLPPCDVLKCDAEGVDGDVFEHYQHWAGVRVTLFEYHSSSDKARMMLVAGAAGLHMAMHTECGATQGVMVWVRP